MTLDGQRFLAGTETYLNTMADLVSSNHLRRDPGNNHISVTVCYQILRGVLIRCCSLLFPCSMLCQNKDLQADTPPLALSLPMHVSLCNYKCF